MKHFTLKNNKLSEKLNSVKIVVNNQPPDELLLDSIIGLNDPQTDKLLQSI